MKELLTLDRAWFLCLQQWKDGIIKRLDEGSGSSVMVLKDEFHCENVEYHYYDKPRKFYVKLLELNSKRITRLGTGEQNER